VPVVTAKTISQGNERKYISKFRELVQIDRKNFVIGFISPVHVLSSVLYEVQHSFLTSFGVARNAFSGRYLKQSGVQKFVILQRYRLRGDVFQKTRYPAVKNV